MSEDPSTARRRTRLHPALAFAFLVGLAGLALPAAAWLVEAVSDRAENAILPLQAALVALVAIGVALWRAPADQRGRRLITAVAMALGAVLVADAVWLLGMAG